MQGVAKYKRLKLKIHSVRYTPVLRIWRFHIITLQRMFILVAPHHILQYYLTNSFGNFRKNSFSNVTNFLFAKSPLCQFVIIF